MVTGGSNCGEKENIRNEVSISTRLINISFTQEAIVGVGLEKLLRSVQVEAEWQENLHVGLLLQQRWIDGACILQLIHTDGILTSLIALSIQWIHYLLCFHVLQT